MILTEEQRGALARAIDYINETDLPVGELDGFDREVLRAMIDSSDPITDVTELVELLAAGEHEQWAAWAQAILDSEPGLSDGRKAAWPGLIATPYENLSEEMKDEDRRVVHLRSQVVLDYIQQQSAEIERLRAENAWLKSDREFQSEEQAARISDLEIDELIGFDLERARGLRDFLQDDCAEVGDIWGEMIAEIERLRAENEEALESLTAAYLLGRHEKAQEKEGKIGPDAKPRSWQITEERKAALAAMSNLSETISCPDCGVWIGFADIGPHMAVLRAMLTEAGQ